MSQRQSIRAATTEALARHEAIVSGGKWGATVLLEGDSWGAYPLGNLVSALEHHVREVFNISSNGHRLEQIAYEPGQHDQLVRAVHKIRNSDRPPLRAVVLSAGGNDFAPVLGMLLEDDRAPDVADGAELDEVMARRLFSRLIRAARHECGLIRTTLAHYGYSGLIPILMHGYDYPWPTGRGFLSGIGPLPGPWLLPEFERRGYGRGIERLHEILGRAVDLWNAALAEESEEHGTFSYVDMRGALTSTQWADEMHPDHGGFEVLGDLLYHRILREVG